MDTIDPTALPRPKRITIELLALDLDSCRRCSGTAANIRSALASASDLLREAGAEVVVRETLVRSAEQAVRLRFESSPTVRINGRDIAGEARESKCADCGELCGCDGGVNCRVWVWRDQEYLEAPRAMILDAVLKAYARPERRSEVESDLFRLPDDLREFFAVRAARPPQACCDETACCAPSEKSVCCGPQPESATCGCK